MSVSTTADGPIGLSQIFKEFVMTSNTCETLPEGWIVWDMGQELGFHLWHCCLIENPPKAGKQRGVAQVLEKDTMHEALNAAIDLAKEHNRQNTSKNDTSPPGE